MAHGHVSITRDKPQGWGPLLKEGGEQEGTPESLLARRGQLSHKVLVTNHRASEKCIRGVVTNCESLASRLASDQHGVLLVWVPPV